MCVVREHKNVYCCMVAGLLWQVQTCLDAAKSTAEAVEGFVHPCGGSGW